MTAVYAVPVEVKLSLAFMFVDVLAGMLKAVKNKELNSTKAREGIYKKASFILFIAFGYLADYAMQYVNMGFNFPAAVTICTLVIVTEAELVKIVAPFLSALNNKEGVKNEEQ